MIHRDELLKMFPRWPIIGGYIISTPFLYFFLAVLLLSEKFHNLPGRNLTSLCFSWAAINTIHIFRLLTKCNALHSELYFLLCECAWYFIISYDTCRTVSRSTNKLIVSSGNKWKRFLAYFTFGWLFPLLLILVFPVHLTEYLFPKGFHYENWSSFITDLRIHCVVYLIMSNYFSVSSLYYIWRSKYSMRQWKSQDGKFIVNFTLPMKLLLISGIILCFNVISSIFEWPTASYIFYIMYCYQGFMITTLFTYRRGVLQSIKPRARFGFGNL